MPLTTLFCPFEKEKAIGKSDQSASHLCLRTDEEELRRKWMAGAIFP